MYGAGEFLDVGAYKHVQRWTKQVGDRPAVKRGVLVNRPWGDPPGLAERHSAADIDAILSAKAAAG